MELFVEAEGITRVDLGWRGMPAQIAAYILEDADGLAVVDPGPGSTLPTLLRALERLGRAPAEIGRILLTHVHLDHAGAAGALARIALSATIHVHPRGAAHLADPARLLSSARRIYAERMDALWGTMEPVPAERLRVLEDGDRVRVGARTLVAVDSPGHASHHHAYHEPDAGLLFGGDVTGIRLGGARYVRPPTPPPDVDVPRWLESLERIRGLRPGRILPTHFGGSTDAAWHLEDLAARLRTWTAWARARLAAGDDLPALAAALERMAHDEAVAACGSEAVARDYETAVPATMQAAGLFRHLTH